MCLDANKWERDTLEAKYHQTGKAYTSLNPIWKWPETNSKLMLGSNISNDASHGILFTECRSFLYLDLIASLDLQWRSSCLKTGVWFKWHTCLNRAMVLRKSICQGDCGTKKTSYTPGLKFILGSHYDHYDSLHQLAPKLHCLMIFPTCLRRYGRNNQHSSVSKLFLPRMLKDLRPDL